ncbi:phosphotransferase, partial [Turicibacter sanguinis]|nr:phosphotransferase [Turicibacter sanguinis]
METQQLLKTLTLYFDGKCEILHGSSGMNNLTRFIRHESGEYVMRVYQNHADVSRILVEQAVLDQLQVLPVPRIVLTKDGQTMAKVGEKLAVVFEFKKGQNLKLER